MTIRAAMPDNVGRGAGERVHSIHTQLMAMAAILVVPIICVAVYLSLALYRSERALFEQKSREAASNTAIAIERDILSIRRLLEGLSKSEAMRDGDLPNFHRQAVNAAAAEDIVVVVRDRNSRQIVNTDVPWGQPLPAVSRLTETDQHADSTGRAVLSDFYVTVSGGRASFAVVMPVSSSDDRLRYLSASSSVQRLKMLLADEISPTWDAAVLDTKGVAFTRLQSNDASGQRLADDFWKIASNSQSGLWTGVLADRVESVAAYQKTSFGWTVVAHAPLQSLEAELHRLTAYLAFGLLALVVLATGTAYSIGRRISGPVKALEDIGDRLFHGEPVVLLPTSNREANNVGRLLKVSSQALRDRENSLAQSQRRYRSLFDSIDEGFCIVRMIHDADGRTIDYRFIETNLGFEKHSGLSDVAGKTALTLQPGLERWWIDRYDAVARTGTGARFEHQSHKNGRWFDVHAVCISQEDAEVAIIFEDVTVRKLEQHQLRISEARFRAVQETSVDGFMVLESIREAGSIVDFAWTYANEAAARIVDRPRDWFVGKRLLQEMPGNQEDGLFDAYVQVVETGEHWTHEFTYQHEALDIYIRLVAAKVDDGFAVTFSDLSVRRRAEEAVRKSEARLAAALLAGKLGVHEFFVQTGVIEWDQEVRKLWGVTDDEPINYETFEQGVHPDDRQSVRVAVDAALDPAGSHHFTAEYRVIHRVTGEIRWIVAEGETSFAHGKPHRLLGTVRDVTARKQAEDQRILLVNELNHRVKNTLATVQSLATQTFRNGSAAMMPFLRRYEDRLSTLAGAHNILTQENWEGANLETVLLSALAPHMTTTGTARITLSGPAVRLTAQHSLALAMAAHELATNAMKYGALSGLKGRVCIAWKRRGKMISLTWKERGGPVVAQPLSSGFGTRLLTRGLARELDGTVNLCFEKSGVICTITFGSGSL